MTIYALTEIQKQVNIARVDLNKTKEDVTNVEQSLNRINKMLDDEIASQQTIFDIPPAPPAKRVAYGAGEGSTTPLNRLPPPVTIPTVGSYAPVNYHPAPVNMPTFGFTAPLNSLAPPVTIPTFRSSAPVNFRPTPVDMPTFGFTAPLNSLAPPVTISTIRSSAPVNFHPPPVGMPTFGFTAPPNSLAPPVTIPTPRDDRSAMSYSKHLSDALKNAVNSVILNGKPVDTENVYQVLVTDPHLSTYSVTKEEVTKLLDDMNQQLP